MLQSALRIIDARLGGLRQNRRFQAGLALIVLLLCIEGGLRWNERLDSKLEQLQKARSELRSLRSQSRDEAALRKTLDDLRQARQTVDTHLWVVPSDAVGQARLQDWLKSMLKRTGIASQSMKISAAQPVSEPNSSGINPTGATAEQSVPPDAAVKPGLRQIQATLSFSFTPANLEQILGEIEGGDAYADVEALTISQRDRRAELTMRILLRVDRRAPMFTAPASTPPAVSSGSRVSP